MVTENIDNVLEYVQRIYSLEKDIKYIGGVEGGFLAQNYIIGKKDKKYFLKRYRQEEKIDINKVHNSKFFFSEHNIPVILPLKNLNNDTLFLFEEFTYALFPFIEGRSVSRENISKKEIKSLARLLAQMHIVGRDYPKEIAFRKKNSWEIDSFEEKYSHFHPLISEIENKNTFDKMILDDLRIKNDIAHKYRVKVEDIFAGEEHLIHGDYHERNVFFDNDTDRIINVFDFEKTCLSPRSVELVRAIDFVCLQDSYTDGDISNAKMFFNEYNSIYPISKEEVCGGLLIFFLKKAYSFWIIKEHYVNNSNRVDCFLKNEYSMLRFYDSSFEEYVDELFD